MGVTGVALPQCQALGHLGMEERLIKVLGGCLARGPLGAHPGPQGSPASPLEVRVACSDGLSPEPDGVPRGARSEARLLAPPPRASGLGGPRHVRFLQVPR